MMGRRLDTRAEISEPALFSPPRTQRSGVQAAAQFPLPNAVAIDGKECVVQPIAA